MYSLAKEPEVVLIRVHENRVMWHQALIVGSIIQWRVVVEPRVQPDLLDLFGKVHIPLVSCVARYKPSS